VRKIAESERSSGNRVIVNLIERGMDARDEEKRRFFDLADELVASKDPRRRRRLKEDLAKMTFGE
jgi:hypothetical protein